MKTSAITICAMSLAVSACGGDGGDVDRPTWARGSLIEAQGRAFIEVPPNRSRFSVTFEDRARESADASQAAIDRATVATAAIRRAAEDQVRITANLSVRPYYQQIERRYDEYNVQLIENVHPDALLGYVATVTISVTVLEPERTDAARGVALAAGPTNAGAISFFLEPTAEDQRAAYQAAVADAQSRARAAATASNTRLGDVLVIQEGQGPCLGSPSTSTGRADEFEEYSARGRAFAPPAPAPPPPPEAPGAVDDLLDAADRYALAADPDPQRVQSRVCAVYAVR